MAWSSNMEVIEDLSQYILVEDEWAKYRQAYPKNGWRNFLNYWRSQGYKKNRYLVWREELHELSETHFWPVDVFEKQAGLKYRKRCDHCNGTGFTWAVAEVS